MTTRAPDTLEPADTWRNAAACGGHNDSWFPNNATQIQDAQTVCRTACPVIEQCATWALTHREEFGVWGGLDERERRRIHKRHTWQLQNPGYLASVVAAAITPTGLPTLHDAYQRRTEPTGDGHTRWTINSSAVNVQGVVYTPMQLAFAIGYGRRAEGTVRAECGITGCVTPGHLNDGRMRREQRLANRAAA
ncbi:WhiB family transcriptional regulator [Streptomyces lunaelactis]|uniref:WhiB family transcriptional regulator n=1 Tax=Streptomyces lunaelactis TaxID=1535768 RepID=UPI00158504D8|nr:WhiB family transcriptional regulator [Streptomyces lunaelactis]NUK22040.1 WhiB family transcriptional regulator [Streptomyces lunaelactis]